VVRSICAWRVTSIHENHEKRLEETFSHHPNAVESMSRCRAGLAYDPATPHARRFAAGLAAPGRTELVAFGGWSRLQP